MSLNFNEFHNFLKNLSWGVQISLNLPNCFYSILHARYPRHAKRAPNCPVLRHIKTSFCEMYRNACNILKGSCFSIRGIWVCHQQNMTTNDVQTSPISCISIVVVFRICGIRWLCCMCAIFKIMLKRKKKNVIEQHYWLHYTIMIQRLWRPYHQFMKFHYDVIKHNVSRKKIRATL